MASIALTAPPASAQTSSAAQADLFGGFGTLRELGTADVPATTYDRGWAVSGAVPVWWSRLSAVGEASGHWRRNIVDETQRLLAVLGGARVRLLHASRTTLFGQALVGIERFSEPGFEQNGFAFQPGAGVDVRLWKSLGVRAQLDYRSVHQGGDAYNEVRVTVGALLYLGAP
jgi:hypothetical protein